MNIRLAGSTAAGALALVLAAPIAHAGAIEDAALTAKVKTALLADSKAPAMNVNVETKDGVVQLNGYVASNAQREAAERAVRGVDGVAKIENNLEVRTATRTASATMDDAAIATKVKAALAADSSVSATDVVVEVRNGTVQLGGFVPDAAMRKRAAEIAGGVDGVQHVDNKLDAKPRTQ